MDIVKELTISEQKQLTVNELTSVSNHVVKLTISRCESDQWEAILSMLAQKDSLISLKLELCNIGNIVFDGYDRYRYRSSPKKPAPTATKAEEALSLLVQLREL